MPLTRRMLARRFRSRPDRQYTFGRRGRCGYPLKSVRCICGSTSSAVNSSRPRNVIVKFLATHSRSRVAPERPGCQELHLPRDRPGGGEERRSAPCTSGKARFSRQNCRSRSARVHLDRRPVSTSYNPLTASAIRCLFSTLRLLYAAFSYPVLAPVAVSGTSRETNRTAKRSGAHHCPSSPGAPTITIIITANSKS